MKIHNVTSQSTDERNKLPGFVDYLKQRQKSAYGRFGSRGLFIISYIQSSKQGDCLECRITLDFSDLPNCHLQPLQNSSSQPVVAHPPSSATRTAGGGKKTGLLGKLVSGAQRTQQCVVAAANLHHKSASSSESRLPTGSAVLSTADVNQPAASSSRTAQQVLAEFRETMQQRMLDFELAAEESTKVELSLPKYTVGLDLDNKAGVTMDVLKYMVYEAAEETNEEWIAFKEPSEFMDECFITIYKEGAAPPAVLDEVNKAELPDEVRGQERALAQERQRQLERQRLQQQRMTMEQAHKRHVSEEADELEILNTQKRDRRTIEDYEREKRSATE